MAKTLELTDRAQKLLEKATKPGETPSDVIERNLEIRKASLSRRGEVLLATLDGGSVAVGIVQDLCLGAGSCEIVKPDVFSLDRGQLGKEPLGVATEVKAVDLSEVRRAAEACPWRAIYLKDPKSGEYIVRSD